MIRLAERTYKEAVRLARDPKAVIVFPLGAIEEHGPHPRCSWTGWARKSWRG